LKIRDEKGQRRLSTPIRARDWTVVAVAFVGACLGLACSQHLDPRFASPSATFATYQQALRDRDWNLLWACYSHSFQKNLSGGRKAWEEKWARRSAEDIDAELNREIAEEKEIGDGIGYLLFYESSLPKPGESPFFYFVRQDDGWHLTSHLDGVFHQRLEKAVESGALKIGQR